MAVHRLAQIADLRSLDRCVVGAIDRHLGGADLGEIALVWDREDDPAIGLLEDIGVVAVIEPRHDDVAALHETNVAPRRDAELAEHLVDPGASGVDDRARGDGAPVGEMRAPAAVDPLGAVEREVRLDGRAVNRRVERVGECEARVVDGGIPIDRNRVCRP